MKYNLSDDHVKRIAAIAHHAKGGNVMDNISQIIHSLHTPETQAAISGAHLTDAMQHRFATKEEENLFKTHIAKAASINRDTLEPNPDSSGQSIPQI